MRRKTRGLLAMMFGVALALVAALGVAPREALADGTTYDPASKYTGYDASSDDTVKIDGVKYNNTDVEWYVIGYDSGAKTVTLLSKQALGEHEFDSIDSNTNIYASSSIKKYVEGLTDAGQPLAGIAGALADVSDATGEPSLSGYGAVPYLLSTGEANDNTSMSVTKRKGTEADIGGIDWWLRSPGTSDYGVQAAFVKGTYGMVKDSGHVHLELGVRPALKLNLESVIFESESKIFSLPGKVTGVTLNPSAVQTIDVNGKVTFTATVAPENATDKTVKWGVEGSAVKLYSDEACKTEVGTDATSTLTVYAKGVSAGTATVTCISNADETKSATCDVTVSAPKYAVAAKVVPEGAGTVALGAAEVAEGETAGIEATPADGYEFERWAVDGAGASIDDATSPKATLTMGTADAAVTATFRKKGEPTPTPGPSPAGDVVPTLSGHVQNVGDVAGEPSGRGARVGTEGRSLRLESFSLSLPKDVEGSVEYRAHVQNVGWDAWVADGAPCGTSAQSLRLEAAQVRLAGKLAYTHSVWYRVHAQNVGTMGWARDGQAAGTAGQSLRVESLEVQVLPRGEVPADYAEGQASYVGAVGGTVHVQNQGWVGSGSGLEFGTTGKSRRLEAVRLGLGSQPVSGGIEYEVHAQNKGWMPVAADGALAGTTGQSRRLEAVRIRLTGDAAQEGNLSVWYRVHSQNQGWLGWTHDGRDAGTEGLSLRAEAIEVQVLPQGQVPRGYDGSAACVSR